MSEILFSEKQRFTQPWIWALLVGIALLLLWALYQQVVLGQPFGDNPAPDTILFALLFLPLGLLLLFSKMYLATEITEEFIHVRFYPFSDRKIPRLKVEEAYVRAYRPLWEYGGWGIRVGFGGAGKAYNVAGRQGIQLTTTQGEKILIGTQRPEEAAAALKRLGY